MSEEPQMAEVNKLFYEKGQKALDLARQLVREEKIDSAPLGEAINYFMDTWKDVLHPAFVSLSCEAVGGNPASTTHLSAAIVILAGAADIHDDITDQSLTKDAKLTVFGKYGKDIAILAGDILILKGMYTLYEACEELPKNKRQEILKNIKQAFFELSEAEAEESSFRGKTDLTGQEYLETIRHKVAAGEASARIGAIMGNASESEIQILGHYARTLGELMRIRDEVIDMYEREELENRFKQGCLPLPILLAFQNEKTREAILKSLEKNLTDEVIDEILDMVLNSNGFSALKARIMFLIDQEKQNIRAVKNFKATLELIIDYTIQGI